MSTQKVDDNLQNFSNIIEPGQAKVLEKVSQIFKFNELFCSDVGTYQK